MPVLRTLAVPLIGAALLAASPGPGAGAASATPPLLVGVLQARTGPGATDAADNIAGLDLAIGEINKAGGILGRQIETVEADDQSDPTAAVNEARRLVLERHVGFVFGPVSSQLTIAITPILNQAKVIDFSGSGSDVLTPTFAPYQFSMNSSAADQAAGIASYAARLPGVRSAAILTDNGGQSKSGVPFIVAGLKRQNIAVSGVQEFQFRSDDKTAQLLSLRNGNPGALVIWANTSEDYAGLLTNMSDIGWTTVPIVGAMSESVLAERTAKIVGADLFDRIGAVADTGWTTCPGEDVAHNRYVAFKDRLKASRPAGTALSPAASGWLYDEVYLMKAAIEGTGGTDPDQIRNWIETHSGEVKAVSGTLSASSATHFLIGQTGLTMVSDPARRSPDGLFLRAACHA